MFQAATKSCTNFFWASELGVRAEDQVDARDGGTLSYEHVLKQPQRILDLHVRRPTARIDHVAATFDRQIEATDREVDRLVYELHGLTEEEIKLVEEATAQ